LLIIRRSAEQDLEAINQVACGMNAANMPQDASGPSLAFDLSGSRWFASNAATYGTGATPLDGDPRR
jgi:hypothetical protein